MADEPWTLAGVRARCLRMRDTVRARKLATVDEVLAVWPGGALSPGRSFGGWIYCYGQMASFLGRRTFTEEQEHARQRMVANMLRGAPQAVEIINPPDGSPGPVWYVYPKGYNALTALVEMERQWRAGVAYREALEAHPAPPPEVLTALALVSRMLVRLQATFLWIVTHPGPSVPYPFRFAMPWDVEGDAGLPPAWCFEADPLDVVSVTGAHVQVNLLRLQALPKLERKDSERGTGWATFFANLAGADHLDVTALMESAPMTALLARSALAADAAQRAERERKAAPPPKAGGTYGR